jgi:hypothetical protein
VQNRSHAVMAQRAEPLNCLDDFPTPPWATRALVEHVIGSQAVAGQTCLEPACNRGFMSSALEEYFLEVHSSDVFNYGYGEVRDFLNEGWKPDSVDWTVLSTRALPAD